MMSDNPTFPYRYVLLRWYPGLNPEPLWWSDDLEAFRLAAIEFQRAYPGDAQYTFTIIAISSLSTEALTNPAG